MEIFYDDIITFIKQKWRIFFACISSPHFILNVIQIKVLYFVKETGNYYLLIVKGTDSAENYSSIVLSLNEFGKMVSCDEITLAYIKEHSECILRSRAAQQISEIYS